DSAVVCAGCAGWAAACACFLAAWAGASSARASNRHGTFKCGSFISKNRSCEVKGGIVAASALDRHARHAEPEPFDARRQRIGGGDVGERPDTHAVHGAPVHVGGRDVDLIDAA